MTRRAGGEGPQDNDRGLRIAEILALVVTTAVQIGWDVLQSILGWPHS